MGDKLLLFLESLPWVGFLEDDFVIFRPKVFWEGGRGGRCWILSILVSDFFFMIGFYGQGAIHTWSSYIAMFPLGAGVLLALGQVAKARLVYIIWHAFTCFSHLSDQ